MKSDSPSDDYREFNFEGSGLGFYRCFVCRSVVSRWDIKKGGCQHCSSNKVIPTSLTLWEKIVQIIKHPKLWTWNDESL